MKPPTESQLDNLQERIDMREDAYSAIAKYAQLRQPNEHNVMAVVLANHVIKLLDEIESMSEQLNWIPITKELPQLDIPVLFCCDIDGEFTDVDLGWFTGRWTDSKTAIAMELPGFEIKTDGTMIQDWSPCSHWMTLPQTPDKQ